MRKGVNHAKVRKAIDQMQVRNWTGLWIGGGVGRSFFNNDPYKDVDLFFCSPDKKAEWVDHMLDLGASIGTNGLLTLHGVTYDHSLKIHVDDPNELIDYADFTCNAVFFSPNWKATYIESHLEDIYNRELRTYHGFTPLNSIERAYKLISLGYKPTDYVEFWASVHRYIKERG